MTINFGNVMFSRMNLLQVSLILGGKGYSTLV